jgi:hypothetical protein
VGGMWMFSRRGRHRRGVLMRGVWRFFNEYW